MSALLPSQFSLRLLGGFALDCDAQPVKLAYEKGRALLAYLAVERNHSIPRTVLASLLWPDHPLPAALANLRLVLHDLRQKLNVASSAPALLQIDHDFVRLDTAAMDVDVETFLAVAPVCPATRNPAYCEQCLSRMETLAGCYRGEFMAGFALPECPDFEDWLQVRRESLHLLVVAELARALDCLEGMGAYARALPPAQRFLEIEPWKEEGLRRVMRLFALSGQRVAALVRYDESCRELERALGVLPSAETVALAESIRQGALSPRTRRREDAATPIVRAPASTERRQVTALYFELAPVETGDPDVALTHLLAPQARIREIVCRHSGFVVQAHGGGVLAYFGYPQAIEAAARLAVQVALAVMREQFASVQLRAGVHTGMVICGGNSHLPDAIGTTTEIAVRLSQIAECGEAMISAATQHLVAGYFDFMSLGLRQLHGSANPQEVFRTNSESGARCRLEAATRLTLMVGREEERATLCAAWDDVVQAKRRIMLLQGDAGIGKSRLVLTLRDALREQPHLVLDLRCLPEHSLSPFYPLAALLGDTPTTSLPQPREQTLTAMLDRLYRLAARQPLLLIIEDLHWADPSTLEFLELFVARKRAAPILAVFTARPQFQPRWRQDCVHVMDVGALNESETAALVAAVAPGIASTRVARIVERADGVPLFAEELAREVAVTDASAIPSSLQDLLTARLDSLGPAKALAQAAATIGREFTVHLLGRVSRLDAATLAQSLNQLQAAGLLVADADGACHFRHALICDVAYQSQTRVERKIVHRLIATELAQDGSDARPEVLAQHWSASGEIGKAVACWIAAGNLSNRQSASHEAAIHFSAGLALIEALKDDPQQAAMELDLQIGLGTVACATQGYASAEGIKAYMRAMELCTENRSQPDRFAAAWGLWASASSRVGYVHALELAQQLLGMAKLGNDLVEEQQGNFAVANTLYWQGEFSTALAHLEPVEKHYRIAHHHRHVAAFGEDVGVTGGAYRSWVLWILGFPEQALKASRQSLALGRRLAHPFSQAYALTFAAILRCRLRQPEEALNLAQEALLLAKQHDFPLWQIGATLSQGWALSMQGHCEAVEAMQQCVDTTRAVMGGVTLVVLEPLTDAYVVQGLYDAALTVNDEAFTVGHALGDRHAEAELHRLKGESLIGLGGNNAAAAEVCFYQALAVSREQRAKSLELRAAMSMARLWHRQGKQEAARHLLEQVYQWFTEGFETPDLKDARELLDSLISPNTDAAKH